MRQVIRYQNQALCVWQKSIRARLADSADTAVACMTQAVTGFDFHSVDVFHAATSPIQPRLASRLNSRRIQAGIFRSQYFQTRFSSVLGCLKL